MDNIARYNRERWNELVRADVGFARPWLHLDEQQARKEVDPNSFIGEIKGKEVLCLAGAGGQQSAAFALLGARVTVLDLSDEMLDQDSQAAAHYGFNIRFEQGDMRDLSRFSPGQFDVVWQAYSINFVPDVTPVLNEVAWVLKTGGIYQVQFHNPFIFDMDEGSWNGEGYVIRRAYLEAQEVEDPTWDVYATDGSHRQVQGPREFRHTLSTMLNGLAGRGFSFLGVYEFTGTNPEPEPGTWDHFCQVCVPWLTLWLRK